MEIDRQRHDLDPDASRYGRDPDELRAFKTDDRGYVVGAGIALKYNAKNVRKVTFNLNTATVPDTLPVTGSVTQIRGGVNHAGGGFSPITWGNDAQNNMTRVGGDYWRKTSTCRSATR